MNYLVDTNVLCEPRQNRPEQKVVQWLKDNESNLYTSALVMGEIRYGIEFLPPNRAKREVLLRWYEQLLDIMVGRVLSVNSRVAEEWAKLQAKAKSRSLILPAVGSLLAATACRYQLTIATDNVNDFKAAGVKIFNPFD
ncbi:MAG TPA: type II toxin-antitoxin system VapC family toxin [Verrucomicrobiae bacterium]|nr:type II toxin-antitoxin system VapC family toxin [Verrucomicrobiae bacterium]